VDGGAPGRVRKGVGVRARGLGVVYPGGVVALRGVDFEVDEGDFSVLVGPSGGGKSTLLRSLNGSVRPATGSVVVGGTNVVAVTGGRLRRLRREIAFIPQQFNLVKRSSVLANVLAGRLGHVGVVPGLLGRFSRESREIALRNVERVGLGDKAARRVDTLSGGEQQRVAIARSLTQEPRIVLADEPVSSLDHDLATQILEIFEAINREDGITVVVALHDLGLARAFAGRIVALDRGRVAYSGGGDGLTLEQLRELIRRPDDA
jgi:phosphonate transport system ATP-binding protein